MIIKNAQIVLEDQIIEGFIEIKDKKIVDIVQAEYTGNDMEVIDAQNNFLMPGFIDCHVHGGYGISFESGNEKAYQTYAQKTLQEGVTSFCLSAVTNSIETDNQCLIELGNFIENYETNSQILAHCLGAHMEGPFISELKKGAHDPKLLLKPNIEITKKWLNLSQNHLAIMTYAPENQDGSYTKWLIENKILPSAGHSNISAKLFDEREYPLGVRHVTHLFNQMSEVNHHNPGLAVSALIYPDVICEVISDGVHLQDEILKLIYETKTANGICIITDGMYAKGLNDGDYKLGQLDVVKKGIQVNLKVEGNLAASAAPFDHNVRYFQKVCNIPLTELVKMTSINIAKQLNVYDQVGSIEVNKIADLVILNQNLEVVYTIVGGKVGYQNEH